MQAFKLRELVERLGGLLRAEQRALGLKRQLQPVHYDVLQYLSRCNRYSNTPAAVTDYLQITKGTVSQTIKVLADRGLVLKQPDKKDARVVRLRLSAAGRRAAAEAADNALWNKAAAGIDAASLEAAESVLGEILRNVQRRSDVLSFGQCHSCTHFLPEGSNKFRCGLTGEPLRMEETRQICREHAEDAA